MFAEQGLVGENRQAERAGARWRLAGVAAIAARSALALLAGWAVSFLRNQAYLADVQARVPDVQAAVAALPPATAPTLSVLPPGARQGRRGADAGGLRRRRSRRC